MIRFEDMPEDFSRALSQNFCAMKYVNSLPERKLRKVIRKAQQITNPTDMQSYVLELGNKIF